MIEIPLKLKKITKIPHETLKLPQYSQNLKNDQKKILMKPKNYQNNPLT